jgi:hypothetical protein
MKQFLLKCDMPNWCVILFWLLCYMHTVLGQRLENMRSDAWKDKYEDQQP